MPLPTSHTNFFSSLKQVEKRLKSEIPPQQLTTYYTPTQSLSPPIYLHCDHQQPNTTTTTSTLQDSETPQAFLSNSPEFPRIPGDSPPSNGPYHPEPANGVEDDEVDDIRQLIQLLGLSEWIQGEQKSVGSGPRTAAAAAGGSCCCEGGFYSRIAGVKGPQCGKEVERLEGWVEHFYNGGGEEMREPFRLAHLLLGKAVFDSERSFWGGGGGGGGGFWGLEFPSTIEEFLRNDPPNH